MTQRRRRSRRTVAAVFLGSMVALVPLLKVGIGNTSNAKSCTEERRRGSSRVQRHVEFQWTSARATIGRALIRVDSLVKDYRGRTHRGHRNALGIRRRRSSRITDALFVDASVTRSRRSSHSPGCPRFMNPFSYTKARPVHWVMYSHRNDVHDGVVAKWRDRE